MKTEELLNSLYEIANKFYFENYRPSYDNPKGWTEELSSEYYRLLKIAQDFRKSLNELKINVVESVTQKTDLEIQREKIKNGRDITSSTYERIQRRLTKEHNLRFSRR